MPERRNKDIYFVPESDEIVAIDVPGKFVLWNYLSNELSNKPVKTIDSTSHVSKFFSGPFPQTIAALGTYQKDNCFLIFHVNSDIPSYYSSPIKTMGKGDFFWSKIGGISDDFKSVLLFTSPPGAIFSPTPLQRLFVLDVPSMRVIAKKTTQYSRIREAFLSPDGKHVIVLAMSRRRHDPSHFIDIYVVSVTDKTGNWLQYDKDGVVENRKHNAANEIQDIVTHDKNGNMTLMPGQKAKYDAWNRLVEVRDTSDKLLARYDYNGMNQRIAKNVSGVVTQSFFNEKWQELESVTNNQSTSYVWGSRYIDDLIYRENGEKRLCSLSDPNWNVVALIRPVL